MKKLFLILSLCLTLATISIASPALAGKGGAKGRPSVPLAAVYPEGTVAVNIFVWSQSNFNDPLGNGGCPGAYLEWDNYWGDDAAFFADSGATDALGFVTLHAYPGWHRVYMTRKGFRSGVQLINVGVTDTDWVLKIYPESSWYNPF